MQILFCERCGLRISPGDLEKGRCQRDGPAAWCPACTQAMAGAATPALAEVVAMPLPQPPVGVLPSTGAQPVPAKRTTGRPSMLAPPEALVARAKRSSTAAARRPTTGKVRAGTTSGLRAGRPGSGTQNAPSDKQGRERFNPDAVAPTQDHTLLFIVVGALLLILGMGAVGFLMARKQNKPPRSVPGGELRETPRLLACPDYRQPRSKGTGPNA